MTPRRMHAGVRIGKRRPPAVARRSPHDAWLVQPLVWRPSRRAPGLAAPRRPRGVGEARRGSAHRSRRRPRGGPRTASARDGRIAMPSPTTTGVGIAAATARIAPFSRIDDRRECLDAEHPEVRDRERAAAELAGLERAPASAGDELPARGRAAPAIDSRSASRITGTSSPPVTATASPRWTRR